MEKAKLKLQARLEKLETKRYDLDSKLFDAKLEENRKFRNLGWGAGMRRSKISISSRKTDSLTERIEKIDEEIKTIKNTLNHVK